MRIICFGGLFLISVMAGTSEGQVKLAVETCSLKSGHGQEYARATQALVDYLSSSSEDLPGNVYGAFREVAAAGERVSFVFEVENLGEFEAFILARIAANESDQQRGTLFRAIRSHLEEVLATGVSICPLWSFRLTCSLNRVRT